MGSEMCIRDRLQVAEDGVSVPTVVLGGEMSCSSCRLCDSGCGESCTYRFELEDFVLYLYYDTHNTLAR